MQRAGAEPGADGGVARQRRGKHGIGGNRLNDHHFLATGQKALHRLAHTTASYACAPVSDAGPPMRRRLPAGRYIRYALAMITTLISGSPASDLSAASVFAGVLVPRVRNMPRPVTPSRKRHPAME